MALRRPVKWIEDRMEHFRASTHGRESIHDYRLAAGADGRFVAATDQYTTDIGGWNSPFGSAQLSSVVFTGPYKVVDAAVERRVALTNKTPIGAYRGYGQPEVNFALEVLVDRMARKLGRDPLELRALNMLRPEDLPWKTPSGAVYDSGDYLKTLHMAADAVDYAAHRESSRIPRDDGRLVGIGFASFVERTGYASARFLANRGSQFGAHESVTLRANRSGTIDLYTGVSSIGQSSETAFAQLCAEVLGVDYDVIRVHAGDTAASPLNTGSFASRTLIAAAGALREAALPFRDKVLRLGAWILEISLDEAVIEGTLVRHCSDPGKSVPLAKVFTYAIFGQGIPPEETPGLETTSFFEPPDAAFSFGTAAAVVAVDPETGEFKVERFVMVHDCGVAVNPLVVEGQVRGALVQGLGAALGEELRYDRETGQLVSGSMLDYFVPMAADVPPIELLHTEVPSSVTTFGVRGVGEVGTIPPGAAVANAICNALADYGVELSELPITPESVWQALTAGQQK
jgi:carbon-monoxide dehydrogenase large subunit